MSTPYLIIVKLPANAQKFVADPKAQRLADEYPNAHLFESLRAAQHVARMLEKRKGLFSATVLTEQEYAEGRQGWTP